MTTATTAQSQKIKNKCLIGLIIAVKGGLKRKGLKLATLD